MSGRAGAWAFVAAAAAVIAGCGGEVRSEVAAGATGAGGGTHTGSGGGASTSGTGASGAGAAGTGAAGTGASGTGASGTGASGTGASGTGGTSTGTACADAQDQGALTAQQGGLGLQLALCYNSPSDPVSCLQNTVGLTEGCAVCYADASMCFVDTCGDPCSPDAQDPACKACFDMACLPALSACAGPVPG